MMGDFNEVRDESEKMGSQLHLALARSFNQVIDLAGLVDIPLVCPRFTWSNNKWDSKFSKLDTFLVLNGVFDSFPHLMGLVLEKRLPYHHPILLLD